MSEQETKETKQNDDETHINKGLHPVTDMPASDIN